MIESEAPNGQRWMTVGVSANVIDASFNALYDSIVYQLLNTTKPTK
jgi:2-isopropylmalate synthase